MATPSDNHQIDDADLNDALATLKDVAVKTHAREFVNLTNSYNEITSEIDKLSMRLKSTSSQAFPVQTDSCLGSTNGISLLIIIIPVVVSACNSDPALIIRFTELLRQQFPEIYKVCIDRGLTPSTSTMESATAVVTPEPEPEPIVEPVCVPIPATASSVNTVIDHKTNIKRSMLGAAIHSSCFREMAHIDLLRAQNRDELKNVIREQFNNLGVDMQYEHIRRRVHDKRYASLSERLEICVENVMAKLDREKYEY